MKNIKFFVMTILLCATSFSCSFEPINEEEIPNDTIHYSSGDEDEEPLIEPEIPKIP